MSGQGGGVGGFGALGGDRGGGVGSISGIRCGMGGIDIGAGDV